MELWSYYGCRATDIQGVVWVCVCMYVCVYAQPRVRLLMETVGKLIDSWYYCKRGKMFSKCGASRATPAYVNYATPIIQRPYSQSLVDTPTSSINSASIQYICVCVTFINWFTDRALYDVLSTVYVVRRIVYDIHCMYTSYTDHRMSYTVHACSTYTYLRRCLYSIT